LVSYDDLGKLDLTEMAFKEALRLIPPVPSLPRRAMRDFEFGGYRIPAGTGVGISPSAVHMDPNHWPDPQRFDPLRFTPERTAKRHKYAWVPFGGGAHNVPGAALRLYAGESADGPDSDPLSDRDRARLCAEMAALADPQAQGWADGTVSGAVTFR
jgi:hypothetical protein